MGTSTEKNRVPTVISTFAGCGGSSLGYKIAGFRELLAIDFDGNSIETFKLNFPEVPVWHRDIRGVSGGEITDFCGIQKGELDILDGSPPCQGFSIVGKRDVNDERNDLSAEYIRLLGRLAPKVFVMENVPGMIRGKMKGRFNEIMTRLRETGYDVRCRLMNAKHYGVPQSRERLIWIGVRKDLNIRPDFPKPNGNIITVNEALKDCPEGIHCPTNRGSVIFKYVRKLKCGEEGSKWHPKSNFFNLRRLNGNKPSYTLPKNAGRNIIHHRKNRFITDKEAARLSSFPDDFRFVGSAHQRISRIGNAVMPNMMAAIAKNIKNNILFKQQKYV